MAGAEPLWRAIAVYRFASIGYAVLLAVINRADYSRPGWAWVVIAAMTAWTAATTVAYARPERRTPLLLSADLAVTAGLLLSTAALQYRPPCGGAPPVTAIWVAGPVLAWAVQYGRAGATPPWSCPADFLPPSEKITVPGVVLLLRAGVVVGHPARLAAEVETERLHVLEVEAAQPGTRAPGPRHPRLGAAGAAMVQRRGAEAGGGHGPAGASGTPRCVPGGRRRAVGDGDLRARSCPSPRSGDGVGTGPGRRLKDGG